MDLIPIGEAAARLGMSPSALRYYDERVTTTNAGWCVHRSGGPVGVCMDPMTCAGWL